MGEIGWTTSTRRIGVARLRQIFDLRVMMRAFIDYQFGSEVDYIRAVAQAEPSTVVFAFVVVVVAIVVVAVVVMVTTAARGKFMTTNSDVFGIFRKIFLRKLRRKDGLIIFR